MRRFVIPGLTRNPVLFQIVTVLDAGSVIPDLIRDRHDGQKLNAFLNYDTASKAGTQKYFVLESPLRRGRGIEAHRSQPLRMQGLA
jgi:hypothetical protein